MLDRFELKMLIAAIVDRAPEELKDPVTGAVNTHHILGALQCYDPEVTVDEFNAALAELKADEVVGDYQRFNQ